MSEFPGSGNWKSAKYAHKPPISRNIAQLVYFSFCPTEAGEDNSKQGTPQSTTARGRVQGPLTTLLEMASCVDNLNVASGISYKSSWLITKFEDSPQENHHSCLNYYNKINPEYETFWVFLFHSTVLIQRNSSSFKTTMWGFFSFQELFLIVKQAKEPSE